MEIIQERLEREFNLDLITTAPSVVYHVLQDRRRRWCIVDNPAKLPPPQYIERIEEPYRQADGPRAAASTSARSSRSARSKRGKQKSTCSTPSADRVIIIYELPFAEVLFDFHDKLKSVSRGYASMDYELIGYRAGRPREGRHARERRAARRAHRSSSTARRRYTRGRASPRS